MTSLRQTEANRTNARHSTGPRTEEGKLRSRGNALKHGLAGAGAVQPDDEAEAVAARLASWREVFRPATGEEEWLLGRAVLHSVRLDRCQALGPETRAHLARRAALCWDDDRRLAAEETGAALARSPSRVSRRLTGTPQGCVWLLQRWRALGAAFEAAGDWTAAQRSLAHDLLGTPAELRGDLPGAPPALVAREVARLEALRDGPLRDLDEMERDAAELGLEFTPSPALTRLRRYEDACLRQYQWARARLTVRRPVAAPEAPAPAVAPPAPTVRPAPVAVAVPPAPPAPAPLPDAPASARRPPVSPEPTPDLRPNRRARRAAQKHAGRRR